MLWLVPLILAALGGLIAGWPGAPIGFALGCIIAAFGTRKRGAVTEAPQSTYSAKRRSRTVPAIPPPLPEATTVERLHEIMRQLEAKSDRPGIGESLSFGREEEPLPRRGGSKTKLTWYSPGQSLIHAGLLIDSGMVYTSDRSLAWPGEPSAIITNLSVGRAAANPLSDFGYYPSYDRLSSEQRRGYLEWLAAGRKDTDPTQRSLGYIFIFFYGLERRILLEGDRHPALLEEILRLLQHYGSAHKSRSLRTYLLQLLHFAGWQLGHESYRMLWPQLLYFDRDRPGEDGIKFVLANLHQRGETLDWRLAYRLALADEESRRSTVVVRAQEKFFALFERRFNEQYPEGLRVDATKQEVLVQYRPASGALAQFGSERQSERVLALRIPNAAGLRRQFQALPAIWNSCVDDLSGYCRALRSKKQGRDPALAEWRSLPPELRRINDHPLKSAFSEILANSPREGDYTFVPTAMLATLAGVPERARLTAAHSREVAEMTSELGWHLGPDPRITGIPLAWNQELALFSAIQGQSEAKGSPGPLRLLYLAVTIAAADGVIEPEELDTFYQLITTQVIDEEEWRSVRATEASLRRDANVALRSLPQMSKLIPTDSRQFVLRLMAHIAAADGEVSLDELKVLRRIARAFELNPDSVEQLLREDEAFREVTVAEAERGSARGETIPTRPVTKPTIFVLNQERIKTLTQETQEVISLLSVVMAEPEETPPPSSPSPSMQANAASPTWLEGLEGRYHAAVLILIRHDEVTVNDFDHIAKNDHLMPDDLFNSVNAWADETLGDFLLERGENLRVFRNLLPDTALITVAA